jgi:hypothetical protein
MDLRLHRHGRFRRWLGARLGVGEEGGDRLWRRIVHALGALVLVYYVVPTGFFVIVPKEEVLLLALAVALALEALRHLAGLELPTIRPYEQHRIASFAFYAIALVGAILLFPRPVAAAVILGTALVDPLVGELRGSSRYRGLYPSVPFVLYVALAFAGLALIGSWPALDALALAVVTAAVGLASEYPKTAWVDDDLAMTFVPALVVTGLGVLVFGLPG